MGVGSFTILLFLIMIAFVAAMMWLLSVIDRFAKKTGWLWLSSFALVVPQILVVGFAGYSIVVSLDGVSRPGYPWWRHIGTIAFDVVLLLNQLPWRKWIKPTRPNAS